MQRVFVREPWLKVLLFVRDLDYGGTQRQISALAQGLGHKGHDVTIAVFYPGGGLEREVDQSVVTVRSLGKQRRWDVFSFVAGVAKLLRHERPDVIYSMLDGPNLYAALLKGYHPGVKLTWGIRSSNVEWSNYPRLAYLTYRLCILISSVPQLVIFNSNAGLEFHASEGLKTKRSCVISNGIDTERYYPDSASTAQTRISWGVNPEDLLIGVVGRLDAMKDLPTFFHAVVKFAHKVNYLKIICVGDGPAAYKKELCSLVDRLELTPLVNFIGFVDDMRAVYNTIDVLVSSSVGEGFPNVIGEAMACGTPCIATDVGDSAQIIGDAGYVVSPRKPECLAAAILGFLQKTQMERRELSMLASTRIQKMYGIETMVDRTEEKLKELIR